MGVSWWKRFIPLSTRGFHKRMDMIDNRFSQNWERIQELESEIHSLKSDIVKLGDKMAVDNKDFREFLRKLQIDIKVNRQLIREKTMLYDIRFEQAFYKGSFDRDFEMDPDFPQRFARLISGLDRQSIQNVIQMLRRRQAFVKGKAARVEMFTSEEQEKIDSI